MFPIRNKAYNKITVLLKQTRVQIKTIVYKTNLNKLLQTLLKTTIVARKTVTIKIQIAKMETATKILHVVYLVTVHKMDIVVEL